MSCGCPPNIAQALRLPPGSSAYRVVGVRHADDGPFQHVTAWVPWRIGRGALRGGPLEEIHPGRHRAPAGRPIKFLEQVADAVLAPRHVAELAAGAAADAAPVLRAHVLRGQRRSRRARDHLPGRPPLSVPRRLSRSDRRSDAELFLTRAAMPYRVGFDVGGTFTDFVLQTPTGELITAKRLTTYPDPSEACLAGLDELDRARGRALARLAQAVHGTTLGSNIVIERKARGVGLLTTRGFRDVLLIGREKRYQVYDLQIEKPAPLVRRRLIGEVTERVLADGSVRTPLDEADARRAIRELAAPRGDDAGRLPAARLPQSRARAAARRAGGRGGAARRRSPSRTRCRRRSVSTSAPRRPWSTPTS